MDKIIEIILIISASIITLAILLATFRFVKGPKAFNRIVAMDLMTISSLALMVLIAYFAERIIYLDVAIVYGLLSFIGVIIVARYFEDYYKEMKN